MSILRKQKCRNSIKIIGFIVMTVLILAIIFPIFNYKDMGGGGGFQRLYNSPPNSMDVMFFGSSRAHCTIDHGYLWDHYGIAGYTLSAGAQKMDSTYYCVQEALRCQNPKVIFVEISFQVNNGEIEDEETDVYRNYLGMKVSGISHSFANYLGRQMNMSPEEKEELYTRFPIIHSRYRELEKADFIDDIPFMRGYRGSFEEVPFDTPVVTEQTIEISQDNREFIEKLISLSEEKNVPLVLFASPYVVSEEEQMRINAVGEIARENGIPFINFNCLYQETGIDFSCDFRDSSHVNNAGAQKVTEYLAQYIKANYETEDHRGDNQYILWDQNAQYLHNKELRHALEQRENINDYLTQLSEDEKDVILIQFVGNYQALGDVYLENIMKFGISQEDYIGGGYYFLCGGSKTEKPEDISIDENQVIWIQGEAYQTEIENGVNVVVYDKELKQVIDVAGDDIYLGLSMSHLDLKEQ